jgi:CO/xanthine dehydrogenase Mo-binding subunit
MEYLVSREGRILNPYLSTYLIPTSLDVPPKVKSVVLEHPDPIGPWGVRGMAEMPFLPLAPAIAAAIFDATGVWMDSQPFTGEKVLKALRRQGIGAI